MNFSGQFFLKEIFVSFVVLLVLHSCHQESIKFDYCAVAKAHSTYVNYDVDSPTYITDRAARHKIFKETFNDFINYSRIAGFPVRKNIPASDTCKSLFVVSTLFIHIVQSDPEYFLGDEVRPFIVDWRQKGLIEDRLLLISFYSFLQNKAICDSTLEEMIVLMKDFGLYEEAFQGVSLKELVSKAKVKEC